MVEGDHVCGDRAVDDPGDLDLYLALADRADGPILFGTHAGVRWRVEEGADGAVLGGCGPTCAARSHVVITGDVTPNTTDPTAFTGALVEQLFFADGACGPCVLPCAARYALDATLEAP